VRGCTVLPEALFFYRSLRICRLLHAHKLSPKVLNVVAAEMGLSPRIWKVIFGTWAARVSMCGILRCSQRQMTLSSPAI
jgi:hypothetical protein